MDATTRDRMRGWIQDIDALESHVVRTLEGQLDLEPRSATVGDAIRSFNDTVQRSRLRLGSHLTTFDAADQPRPGLAETVGDALGSAASMVDHLRDNSVAKAMRDDVVAFASLAAGYEMLLTTALAVGDAATSRVAELALADYTGMVVRANRVLPTAAMDDLQADAQVQITNPAADVAVRSALDRAQAAA